MVTKGWYTGGEAGLANAVISVLMAGEAIGRTADEIAAALNVSIGGEQMQQDLEYLVHRGVLDRRGVGHGALYCLPVQVASPCARATVAQESPISRATG